MYSRTVPVGAGAVLFFFNQFGDFADMVISLSFSD